MSSRPMTECASTVSTDDRGGRHVGRKGHPRFCARASGRRGALPGGDRQGSVRQPARRLRSIRRSGRRAARGSRLRRRAEQDSGSAGQGERHGLGDQPDRPAQVRAGRTDHRAQCAWRRRAARNGLDARPLRGRSRRRLDVRPRRRSVEVGYRDLRVRHPGARKERRGAKRIGRAARHLRRGGGRRNRSALHP